MQKMNFINGSLILNFQGELYLKNIELVFPNSTLDFQSFLWISNYFLFHLQVNWNLII